MRRLTIVVLIGLIIGVLLGAVLASENAMHIYERPQPDGHLAAALASNTGSSWQPAAIQSTDGFPLSAWLIAPAAPNGAAVILLHGVADSRQGTAGHAQFLLQAGYTVLMPDARGHGASGGPFITYGIRESGDIHAWAGWLFRERPVQRLYGLGESMGAAILLQSLPHEPRFRAVVAECPFATFSEIAYDRLTEETGIPRAAFWPIVNGGILYARLRYNVNLRDASPAAAIRNVATPILLIHGTLDTNIPIRHSRELHAANPTATELWEVAGAHHVDSLSSQPEAYMHRILDWFESHQ
jgi:dipeptidyl aminopeptidase/acylaminoacyl peptidase